MIKCTDGVLAQLARAFDWQSKGQKTYFSKVWMQMRKALALPETMQLYSLRDSGLSDMLHAGIDPLTVRQHADHSSAAMQDIYINHHNPALNDIIYNNAPEF